jgi:hypothetical protein
MLARATVQLKDKDTLIDNLTLALSELKDNPDKADGLQRMVTQTQELISARRYGPQNAAQPSAAGVSPESSAGGGHAAHIWAAGRRRSVLVFWKWT